MPLLIPLASVLNMGTRKKSEPYLGYTKCGKQMQHQQLTVIHINSKHNERERERVSSWSIMVVNKVVLVD